MYSAPFMFMTLVLITSKGEQTVVATKPASKLAEKWVVTLSLKYLKERERDLSDLGELRRKNKEKEGVVTQCREASV